MPREIKARVVFSIHDPVSQCKTRMLKLSSSFSPGFVCSTVFLGANILPRNWLVKNESEGMFISKAWLPEDLARDLLSRKEIFPKWPLPRPTRLVKLNYEVLKINFRYFLEGATCKSGYWIDVKLSTEFFIHFLLPCRRQSVTLRTNNNFFVANTPKAICSICYTPGMN